MSKLFGDTVCELNRVSNDGMIGGSTSNALETDSDASQLWPVRISAVYDRIRSVYAFDCTVLSSIVNVPVGSVPTFMPGSHCTQFGLSTPADCTGAKPPSRRVSGMYRSCRLMPHGPMP